MDKQLQIAINEQLKKEIEKDPRMRFANKYNTGLNPQEFYEFYNWAKNKYGSHENIVREMGDYDLQGAWKGIKNKKIDFDPVTGHLPDTYKKPNHITFSNQSQYHTEQTPGGQWLQKNNKWFYKPSPTVMQNYPKEKLQDYFKKYEKDTDLLFD